MKMLQIVSPILPKSLVPVEELPDGVFPYKATQLVKAALCLAAATAKKANVTAMVMQVNKKLIRIYVRYSPVFSLRIEINPITCHAATTNPRAHTIALGHPEGREPPVATMEGGPMARRPTHRATNMNSRHIVYEPKLIRGMAWYKWGLTVSFRSQGRANILLLLTQQQNSRPLLLPP
jgi:hypothetical protein